MYYSSSNFYKNVIMLLFGCGVLGQDLLFSQKYNDTNDLMSRVYLVYKKAIENGTNFTSPRRFYKDNKEYIVHVQRLKEVNGFKNHNLAVKNKNISKKSLIYINNPVESKLPNAYLTIEEFKATLLNRIKNQRDQFASIKKVVTKVNRSSYNRENSFTHKAIVKKIMPVNVVNANYVSKAENITSFHDQYVNLTVEVKDAILVLQNVTNITIYKIDEIKNKSQSEGKLDDVDKDDTSITNGVSTVSLTNSTTIQPENMRTLKEYTDNVTVVTEEVSHELIGTTMSLNLDDNTNTEVENTIDEVNSTNHETELTTVPIIMFTNRTKGRPFVFMGWDDVGQQN